MRPIIEQASALDRFIEANGWKGCIIGGVATLRWGEVRFTRDVDATVFTGFQDEERYVRVILTAFAPRIAEAAAFALANRVVLAVGAQGVPMDISLGALPFEEEMIARATRAEMAPGLFVRTLAAEDLIVTKAFAARPHDWADVAGIVLRQGNALDWPSIFDRLRPLAELKEAPELLTKLEQVRRDVEAGERS